MKEIKLINLHVPTTAVPGQISRTNVSYYTATDYVGPECFIV